MVRDAGGAWRVACTRRPYLGLHLLFELVHASGALRRPCGATQAHGERCATTEAWRGELNAGRFAKVGRQHHWRVSFARPHVTYRGHVGGEVPPAHVEGPVYIAHPGDVHVARDHKGLAAAELEAGVAVTCTAVRDGGIMI